MWVPPLLILAGKEIALISKEGPEKTILESNGESVSGPTGRIVVFVSGETQDTVIAGFTTRRGLNIQERFLFIITCFGIMLPGRIIPPVHWNMGGGYILVVKLGKIMEQWFP